MNSLKLRNIFVGLAVFLSVVMAFFLTDSFIESDHFSVMGAVKQQQYNNVGLFEVSPLKAAQYYYFQSNSCTWIDIRQAESYKTDHLTFAENKDFNSLKKSDWDPAQFLLVFGDNDFRVKQAVAMLRQVKNARAFAVLGGYSYVKKVLSAPIDFELEANLSAEQLAELKVYREKLTGEKAKPIESQKKTITPIPAAEEDEGC